MKWIGFAVCSILLLSLPASGVPGPAIPRFRMIVLEPPNKGDETRAAAINDRGQVVGSWQPLGSSPEGYALYEVPLVWRDGKPHRLPLLGRACNGSAKAINQAGEIAGESEIKPVRESDLLTVRVSGQPATHAVIWRNGVLHELPTLGGDVNQAVGMNDRGEVAGNAKDARGQEGKTPLQLAVENPTVEMVQLLLAHGAHTDARDENGVTPLEEAELLSRPARSLSADRVKPILALRRRAHENRVHGHAHQHGE